MSVFIFTKKEAALKKVFAKNTQFFSVSDLSAHSPGSDDLTYLDISGFTAADLKKTLLHLKKSCRDTPWGIIDPKGTEKDIASLFFEGASDYLGPSFFKGEKPIDPKHIKEAHQWRKTFLKNASAASDAKPAGDLKTGIKLPADSAFSSWKKMQSGKVMPFYLLYCSLQGKHSFESRLDTKTIAQVHSSFLNYLDEKFAECDGLLWINSGQDCLFLVPPKARYAEEAVKTCVSIIVSAPMVVLETLGIRIPSNFVFALHYGSVTYKPPGKTGTIVSDAVNFIYHLGAKKAESGRLTISGELPDKTIPASLQDCFLPAGEFEGRKIMHTKKFTYSRPWM
jgi:hypothetical protein